MKFIKLFPAILLLFVLQSCIVSRHPNMAFFDNPYYDFKGAKFASINVPMWMLKPVIKQALREDKEGEALIPLIGKISDIKLLAVENGNAQMLSDFSHYLTKNNYEEWMTIKKDKEIINFQAKHKGDTVKKLLLTVKSGSELVYIDISGKFTNEDVSKMISFSEKNDIAKNLPKTN